MYLPSRYNTKAYVFRSGFEFGDPETAIYHFGILLDPLSETAQKWSSILEVSSLNCKRDWT